MEKYIKDTKKKRVVFLTGTRADFGKIKSLIRGLSKNHKFDVHVFATGMHMLSKYGYTVDEIEKEGFPNIYKYINHSGNSSMESVMASTLIGFGNYVKEFKPDLIIVHGDRVEALAGALAGSFQNITVAHIEGGEISGTIDEHIRHAISKVSHLHFVANGEARKRLIQMGEYPKSIFTIGSPDIDIMLSKNLPTLKETKKRYGISYNKYSILAHHAVTTELDTLNSQTDTLVQALLESNLNYIVIHPSNDPGTDTIRSVYAKKLTNNSKFKIFPSIRFKHFLTLLKNASFIIGNSSAGIREAPYYGVPTINLGTRQYKRITGVESIFNCNFSKTKILELAKSLSTTNRFKPVKMFGYGKSQKNFLKILTQNKVWGGIVQKQFRDIKLI